LDGRFHLFFLREFGFCPLPITIPSLQMMPTISVKGFLFGLGFRKDCPHDVTEVSIFIQPLSTALNSIRQ
jgi:hypothetical protein